MMLSLFFMMMPLYLAETIEIDMMIPYPSGIFVDRVENPENGEVFRFGRLQHNMISLRPDWKSIYAHENTLTLNQTVNIILKAEEYAHSHGMSNWRSVVA